MADYTQNVFFGPKDSLATGNANKKIKGTEIDAEFSEIATAIASKLDSTDLVGYAQFSAGDELLVRLADSAAIPSGWSISTVSNKAVKIIGNTTAGADGGTNNFATALNAAVTSSSNGAHTHTYSGTTGNSNNNIAGDGSALQSWATNIHTHSYSGTTASNGAHTHTTNLDVQYREFNIITKD